MSMLLVLGMIGNVAFTDETWPFPFWQKGFGLNTFWSVTNTGATAITATITLRETGPVGAIVGSTTATVAPGTNWAPATYEAWYIWPDNYGYGTYSVVASTDCVYVWGCIYADAYYSTPYNLQTGAGVNYYQPGFTIVDAANPHGVL